MTVPAVVGDVVAAIGLAVLVLALLGIAARDREGRR